MSQDDGCGKMGGDGSNEGSEGSDISDNKDCKGGGGSKREGQGQGQQWDSRGHENKQERTLIDNCNKYSKSLYTIH